MFNSPCSVQFAMQFVLQSSTEHSFFGVSTTRHSLLYHSAFVAIDVKDMVYTRV